MDTTAIRDLIQMYFDASFEGSGEKMDRSFHQGAHIYGLDQEGKITARTRDEFVARVGTPRDDRPVYERQDEIISIEFTGANTAVALVRLRVANTIYTDVLSLLCVDGQWGIIAKMLSGVPAE